jgi:hypothetical protein
MAASCLVIDTSPGKGLTSSGTAHSEKNYRHTFEASMCSQSASDRSVDLSGQGWNLRYWAADGQQVDESISSRELLTVRPVKSSEIEVMLTIPNDVRAEAKP